MGGLLEGVFCCKQKTAYDMRISDWSSDVCSSDLYLCTAEIVRQLNRFRDHLNDHFGSAQAPVIPAGPDGRPWRLTTRQFRRTIAWHIANRPFGTIAGMIQYKHADRKSTRLNSSH